MDLKDVAEVDSLDSLGEYLTSLGYSITRVGAQCGLEVNPKDDLELPKTARAHIRTLRLLADYDKSFQIYFAELGKLGRTQIRPLVESFYRKFPQADYLFVLTRDFSEILFVSPQRITEAETEKPRVRLRVLSVDCSNVYHTDLQVLESITLPEGMSDPDGIWKKHTEAFNVQRVTRAFFDDYKNAMDQFMNSLRRGGASEVEAKECALQLLNRLMLIYFLQRKGWLRMSGKPEKRFLRELWFRYLDEPGKEKNFYRDWLSILFFNVFNGEGLKNVNLPRGILESYAAMPFLNGGLFKRYSFDEQGARIPDSIFKTIFGTRQESGLLEKYNFTVREDTPLEVEVAVDPEMLGKVYESLVLEEEREGRRKAGIFYTPRTEVDFMCRQALMEYLRHHTSLDYKILISLLYDDDYALEDVDDTEAKSVENQLQRIKVVDPACGSGAFLVGMLYVLENLNGKVAHKLKHNMPERFDLRSRIVRRNLYGADIKAWAIRVAELRLWLTLIVDAGDEILSNEPVLPNLTFRLRIGDSLVQEAGGRPLSARSIFMRPPKRIVQLMKSLTQMKEEYYRGAGDRAQEETILQREVEILLHAINTRIDELRRSRKKAAATQQKLAMTQVELPKDEETLERIDREIDELKSLKTDVVESREHEFFFWEIDFAEVFFDGGFDVVIGNPPYVRQEKIISLIDTAGFLMTKDEYKGKLFDGAQVQWGSEVRFEGRSDLYVYFYYQGLSLLKDGGVLCLISSSSWLDVGFGGALQAFLLRNSSIFGIFDNLYARTFEEAFVNTIILLAQKNSDLDANYRNQVAFVAFKVPWEKARLKSTLTKVYTREDLMERSIPGRGTKLHLKSFEDEDLRLRLALQGELWTDGLKVKHEMSMKAFTGEYGMSKWGGMFIRAPDIFYTILERGSDKLVPLGNIAEIRFGIKTGANKFFYVEDVTDQFTQDELDVLGCSSRDMMRLCRTDMDESLWPIESEFLVPVLRRPKECESILVNTDAFQYRLLVCHKERNELSDKRVGKYLDFGSSLGIPKRPTCRARKNWYDIGPHSETNIAAKMTTKYRHYFPASPVPFLVDARFYTVRPHPSEEYSIPSLVATLNSAITSLWLEIAGRSYGGGGGPLDIKVYEMESLPVVHPVHLDDDSDSLLESSFAKRPVQHVWKEADRKDRRELDSRIFDIIGLDDEERNAVYESLVELVRLRLSKARSL